MRDHEISVFRDDGGMSWLYFCCRSIPYWLRADIQHIMAQYCLPYSDRYVEWALILLNRRTLHANDSIAVKFAVRVWQHVAALGPLPRDGLSGPVTALSLLQPSMATEPAGIRARKLIIKICENLARATQSMKSFDHQSKFKTTHDYVEHYRMLSMSFPPTSTVLEFLHHEMKESQLRAECFGSIDDDSWAWKYLTGCALLLRDHSQPQSNMLVYLSDNNRRAVKIAMVTNLLVSSFFDRLGWTAFVLLDILASSRTLANSIRPTVAAKVVGLYVPTHHNDYRVFARPSSKQRAPCLACRALASATTLQCHAYPNIRGATSTTSKPWIRCHAEYTLHLDLVTLEHWSTSHGHEWAAKWVKAPANYKDLHSYLIQTDSPWILGHLTIEGWDDAIIAGDFDCLVKQSRVQFRLTKTTIEILKNSYLSKQDVSPGKLALLQSRLDNIILQTDADQLTNMSPGGGGSLHDGQQVLVMTDLYSRLYGIKRELSFKPIG
ncbi:hypothetical protein ANO11243_056550 [Dothideomycetidae sp. 11243]|nr:hypothetical protein ANO11243_056550 [fungal sp. No.11243]